MRSCLGMNGNIIASGIREGGEIGIGGCDHQMTIKNLVRAVADGFDHGWAKGDVRYKMTIHNIEMNPIRTRFNNGFNLVAQFRKISGEDRGSNQGARHGNHSFDR